MDIELGLGPDYTSWAQAFASYSLFRYIFVMYFVIVYTDHSRGLFRQLLSAHMA